MKVFAFAALGVALAASWSGAARAEVALSIEPQVGFMVPNDPELLVGGALRAGYAFDSLYPILIMPELSLDAHYITGNSGAVSLRAAGGIRAGILAVVEPSIYVHGGYGALHANFTPQAGIPEFDPWSSTFTLDAGAAVDYRVSRLLTFGASLGYLGFFGEDSLHGGLFGAHVTFWL